MDAAVTRTEASIAPTLTTLATTLPQRARPCPRQPMTPLSVAVGMLFVPTETHGRVRPEATGDFVMDLTHCGHHCLAADHECQASAAMANAATVLAKAMLASKGSASVARMPSPITGTEFPMKQAM